MTRAGRTDRTTGRVSLAELRRREKGLRMRLYWTEDRYSQEADALRGQIADAAEARQREEARRAAKRAA